MRYEDLVTGFEDAVRPLLEFLGLEWDDAVLDYQTHASGKEIINTPSYQAVTEPINRLAMFR